MTCVSLCAFVLSFVCSYAYEHWYRLINTLFGNMNVVLLFAALLYVGKTQILHIRCVSIQCNLLYTIAPWGPFVQWVINNYALKCENLAAKMWDFPFVHIPNLMDHFATMDLERWKIRFFSMQLY